MAMSRREKECDRQNKNAKASLPHGGVIGKRKSVFGKYSDSDMLSWIRGLALNPCNSRISRDSIRPLWNQTLKVRKVMALSDTEFPRRKRKLQQFLKDNKFTAELGLASEISNQQSVTKLSRGQLSHASSVDSTESSGSVLAFEDNIPENHIAFELSCLDNATNVSPLVDSDESISGSNIPPLQDSSNASSSEDTKRMHPRRSIRLMNFIGDHLQRTVVPVGPRFQADVPDWTGILNGDSENLRWLGTRIWPMDDRSTETIARAVGKGRPDSCSCLSPGSTDCIKHHILEERFLVQSDIGPAFLSWKFDEMGEQVSKSWTLKEQQGFESLQKMYPLSNGKNFLKHALKFFPSKGKENILSYYFNVFIPRHLGLQTRSSLKQIDTDDYKAEDIN